MPKRSRHIIPAFYLSVTFINFHPFFCVVDSGNSQLAKHCAQTEFDNLSALFTANLPVPQPLYASGNVLVMSGIITESGKAAVPLNSTHLSPAELKSAYMQAMQIVNDAWSNAEFALCTFNESDLL